MHDFLKFLIFVAVVTLVFIAWQHRASLPSYFWLERSIPVVIFNEKTRLEVAVVLGESERTQALSGRESLEPAEGVLYIFPEDGYHRFSLRGTHLVVDLMWVDVAGKVVHIESAVRPDTPSGTIEPSVPARYVIETNANFAESFGIQVGDSVELGHALARVPESTQ